MDYKKMAAAFAAGGAVLAAGAAYTMKQKNQKQPGVHFSSGGGRHVYLQDSSLSSLAVAAYLIRDYNFDGANIHIFDGKTASRRQLFLWGEGRRAAEQRSLAS